MSMDFETRQAKERLIAGSATQQDRDRVLYFLAESRWTPDQLDAHIRSVHGSLCATCPERQKSAVQVSRSPVRLDWNGIIKAIIYVVGALVGVITALVQLLSKG